MRGPRTWMFAIALCACSERSPEHRAPALVETTLARHRALVGAMGPTTPSRRASPARVASVVLPQRASEPILLEDARSRVAVRFALEGAGEVPLVTEGDLAVGANAAGPGVDLIYRVRPEGVEDFVVHSARPEAERAGYRVELSGVAGLRLVERTLEFMDADGTPRLRMAPPYIVDARGTRHEVDVSVRGCATDRDPRSPWHRPVTAPGAASCAIELRWDGRGVKYPAALDPTWTATKGTMAVPRQGPAMALLSTGKVLVAGGYSPPTAELFDPKTETWATTSSPAKDPWWAKMIALGQGRALFTDFTVFPSGPGYASVYDAATGLWTDAPPGSSDITSLTVLGDGRGLAVGGTTSQIFDPATGAFTMTAGPAIARGGHCAALLPDGRVIAAGGWNAQSNALTSTELFDPALGRWSPGPPMNVPRSSPTCTRLLNGAVLVTGGDSGGVDVRAVLTSETYDPVTNTWSPLAPLVRARYEHAASLLLPSGKVLVTGGSDGIYEITSELYDPTTAQWAFAGDMTVDRFQHASVTLPSGDVLVAGGWNELGAIASSEIFRSLPPAAPCTGDGECPTGHCVDGVCCDQACEATCYACSAAKKGGGADGVCGPIVEGPDPSGRCPVLAASTCGSDGRCNGFGACAVHPKGTTCAPLACSAGVLSQSACDGEGACVPQTASCGAYACATPVSCGTGRCASDADCAPAFACESGACVPRKPVCDGDHTLVGADGTRSDCAPYKCAGSACVARCGSATDCAGDFVCNRDGVCIRADDAVRAADEALFGGCGVGGSSGGGAAGGVVVGVLAACRRRRRRGAR